jgi:hypothetical protein
MTISLGGVSHVKTQRSSSRREGTKGRTRRREVEERRRHLMVTYLRVDGTLQPSTIARDAKGDEREMEIVAEG